MKPTNKKNGQDARKKDLNEDPSKIKSFFKVAPKQFVCENKINDAIQSDNSKAVYMQALKDKLKSLDVEDAQNHCDASEEGAVGYDMNVNVDLPSSDTIVLKPTVPKTFPECMNAGCMEILKEFRMEISKHKALKKVYFTLASAYSELSIKHQALVKAKRHVDEIDIGVETTTTGDIFTENELKFLKCMSLEKKKDSTFILQCLEFAYKNDLTVLCDKTRKGKPESIKIGEDGTVTNVSAKEPVSPVKVVRIKELFLERLSKCDIDSAVYAVRAKDSNMNTLITNGIKNISKRQT